MNAGSQRGVDPTYWTPVTPLPVYCTCHKRMASLNFYRSTWTISSASCNLSLMCISLALEVSYISNTYNSPGGKIMTGAPVSIDHLPNELTSKIFLLSCQPPKFGEKPDDYFCPHMLGAVCRSWREVAWDLPKLWSYIGLVISLDSWEWWCPIL